MAWSVRGIGAGLAILLVSVMAHAEVPGPVADPAGPWREQIHWVPSGDGDRLLYTRICRPRGDSPARVVVINHGKPPDADVPKVKPAACANEAVQWFLARGYLVVMGVRRGYGQTGGTLVEASRSCSRDDLVAASREGAKDIDALVNYAAALRYAQPDRMVVVGQSVGGWATDGYNGVPHPRVVAMISMAGGHGAHIHDIPNNNCRPDQLVLAAGVLGKSATTPMLWIYTENDSYFAPELAKSMHAAFVASGGTADFRALPPFGKEGHFVFFGPGGSAIWGPLVEAYLSARDRAPGLDQRADR